MYKVVIIDDEPLIVEGLSRSIPWEKWDCKVVGFGYDGIEGMEVIRREKPAIVISDISMPEMEAEEEVLYNSEANNFVVNKALAYIREHFREKLQLADVADYCYVSQWHLSKLLNKHTGQNFSIALNKARIAEAKELLKDPAKRIYDIAEEVGFQDLAHFSRVFKKLEGISANEYRNTIS